MLKIGQRVVSLTNGKCGKVEGEHPLHAGVLVRFLGDSGQSLRPEGSLKRITKREYEAAEVASLRLDPRHTAARYDEIINLRMLLLDAVERIKEWELHYSQTPAAEHLVRRIEERAEGWGKEGDCV